jgi:serine/threonine protein kinase
MPETKKKKRNFKQGKSTQGKSTQGKSKHNKSKKGGQLIDAGGYGCVFYPALKCKNKQTRTRGISKLSLKEESRNEWDIHNKILKLLRVIPNYKQYFLLEDISICEPDTLVGDDLTNLEKCRAIEPYNASTINEHLNEFMIINMPYGGNNLHSVIRNDLISFKDLTILLKKLVLNAIHPMNQLNIYHFDIKASNILYKNNNLKLIDFGLLDFKNAEHSVPKNLSLGAINFNSPFSIILFNSEVLMRVNWNLQQYSRSSKKRPSLSSILKFFKPIYEEFIKLLGLEKTELYVIRIISQIYSIKGKKSTNFKLVVTELICRYCSYAIFNYIDFENNVFDKVKYFDTIYSKNVDIYGIVSCYTDYLDSSQSHYSNTFKSHIADLLLMYCYNYTYATKVIPIDLIFDKLTKIST